MKKSLYLLLILLFVFSCTIDENRQLYGVMVTNPFYFVQSSSGGIKFYEEEVTFVFPEINFGESGLINESGIGSVIGRFEGSSKSEYKVSLGTVQELDFLEGKIINLVCKSDESSSIQQYFRIWQTNDDTELIYWSTGGFGMAYYGDDVHGFKKTLYETDAGPSLISFLDEIIKSVGGE